MVIIIFIFLTDYLNKLKSLIFNIFINKSQFCEKGFMINSKFSVMTSNQLDN